MAIYLLWEDATPPAGWTIDENHENVLIRMGDSHVASGAGHTHSVVTAAGGGSGVSEYGSTYSRSPHTHETNTPGSNDFPPYHSLRLIKKDSLPQTLPTGIIGFGGSVLSGWQAHPDISSEYIYIKNQTPAAGGGAGHVHNPPVTTGVAPDAGVNSGGSASWDSRFPNPTAYKGHTHAFAGTIDVAPAEPDFFCMQIIKALSALQKVPHGLIAMFDYTPLMWGGWRPLGGVDKYIKQGIYGDTGGNPNHTHTHNLTMGGTSPCSYFEILKWRNAARCSHTHTVEGISYADYTPPYAQFIFAEYVGNEVLLLGQYGSKMYIPIRGGDINVGDKVRLYPTSGGGKVAIKELWSLNDKITIKKGDV